MEFYLDTEENKSIINQNKWKIFWEKLVQHKMLF